MSFIQSVDYSEVPLYGFGLIVRVLKLVARDEVSHGPASILWEGLLETRKPCSVPFKYTLTSMLVLL